MRKIIEITLFVSLLTVNNFPQNYESLVWPVDVEIFIIIQGLNVGESLGFRMFAQGAVWKRTDLWEFQLTNEYNDVYYPGKCLTVGNTNGVWAYGYNISGGNSFSQPDIGYSLYRFEVYNNYCEFFSDVYYFDYRDCDYPLRDRPDGIFSPYINSKGGNDIWILYDSPTASCSLSIDGALTWQLLNNNAYYSYWDIKNKSTHSPYTNYFPSYWQNCLVIINAGTDNPQLIWGPIPDFEATGYKIYRAIGNSSGLSKINYPVRMSSFDSDQDDNPSVMVIRFRQLTDDGR